ncbi:MAG: response regulator transcription factor [Flavobacteriales bacterium]|nr:MAG: response regulator transcription factor [Flavobacteriales bacterium]
MQPIEILLVDDHHLVIDGMRAILELDPDVRVVGQASNGREAVEMARKLRPRLVIMDISMPDMDGIEATRLIRKDHKLEDTRVMVLSMYGNREFIDDLVEAGASGYLLKNTSREELREAIHSINNGFRYFSKPVQDTMDAPRTGEQRDKAFVPITKREKQIIKLLVANRTSGEVAAALELSVSTVETHRKNILHKLGMHNTSALVRYAVERGWHLEN